MKIKILFNSAALREDLSVGWGLSLFIDNKILFDTGEKGAYLENNFHKLKINLSPLKAVIISHDHWDHTGGLEEVLKRKPGLPVYVCPNFSDTLKQKIVLWGGCLKENLDFCEIEKNMYVTGEIIGSYKGRDIAEQALVLDTDKGLTVITGCAHPGILNIIEKVRTTFPGKRIYAALGGFHLMDTSSEKIHAIIERFIELGIEKVGPTHCSGTDAGKLFQAAYGKNFLSVKVAGQVAV